ncbi:MAG: DUF4352 domain-containing protein [Chloroflexi bacterium]|nr:DUF4352 domain-containing protein [Chloroflexota bacterium]
MIRVTTLAATLLMLLLAAACSGRPAPTPTPEPVTVDPTGKPTLGKVVLNSLGGGSVVEQIRVTPKAIKRGGEGDPQPRDGNNEIVAVDVELENIAGEAVTVALNSYTLVDDAGRRYAPLTAGSGPKPTGSVAARGKHAGQLLFEVPKDAKGLRLIFSGGTRWDTWQLES